jgi:hypothetical protein
MDQIITLLSNLFNLTKVASVTLPGIALAGALAVFLRPRAPSTSSEFRPFHRRQQWSNPCRYLAQSLM